MIPTLYRGSVKNLLGPIALNGQSGIIFEYTDAYSVFDWGKMPDLLPRKGDALAILTADIFEKLRDPEIWRAYSKTPSALALRKANRFGAIFNEIGEELQSSGLKTHYLGILEEWSSPEMAHPHFNIQSTGEVKAPFRRVLVQSVSVVKPLLTSVLGRTLPDYYLTRTALCPRLIPLEVVFRLGCPTGSSLLERVVQIPDYLASLGFPEITIHSGGHWDFPLLEFFTKLESTDRPVSLSESLAISGLSAQQIQDILLKTAWVAGLLKSWFLRLDISLEDGKLEWAITQEGQCFLVDAIGPDELRLMKDGIQISKEWLRLFYRKTSWYTSLQQAKAQAQAQGIVDWKRFVHETPPLLPSAHRELASQIYLALTNAVTERQWFSDAWSLERVLSKMEKLL